jgi:hypothetical protein
MRGYVCINSTLNVREQIKEFIGCEREKDYLNLEGTSRHHCENTENPKNIDNISNILDTYTINIINREKSQREKWRSLA